MLSWSRGYLISLSIRMSVMTHSQRQSHIENEAGSAL